jgi:uncharacterized protein YyaL (SSP411 family)
MRVKDDYDGAEPSGNSVAIYALLRLSKMTDRADFRAAAEKSLKLFGRRLKELPQAVPFMLVALDYFIEEPLRVVIAGDVSDPSARELLTAAHGKFNTEKVILGTTGPVESFAKTLPGIDGKPAVYLCTGAECKPPTTDPKKLRELL